MSYKINRIVANMVTGSVLFVAYIVHIMNNAPADGDLKGWATLMLSFILISVIALVTIQIVFHVIFAMSISIRSRGRDDDNIERIIESSAAEDEMDKLIDLKSNLVGYASVCIGFIAVLIGFAFFDTAVAMAMNILLTAFVVGSLAEGGAKIFFYEVGVKNG